MSFSNPIVGGETLIRRAIHSPDFLTNVAGWSINRDGTAEFLEAIIRGILSIGGGVVTINNNGVFVEDADHYFSIDIAGGFRAVNKPVDGSSVFIQDNAIFFQPIDPFNSQDTFRGFISAQESSVGGTFVNLTIKSPEVNSQDAAFLRLWAASASGLSRPTFDIGSANEPVEVIRVHPDSDIKNFTSGRERYGRGRIALATDSGDIALTTTPQVAFTIPSTTYKANRAYEARMYARYVDGDSPSVFLRKGTTTGGTVVVDAGRVPLPINNTLTFETPMPFIVGGSDVTTQLNVTMTSLNTTTQAGPRKVEIFDIGPASDYSDFSANTLS